MSMGKQPAFPTKPIRIVVGQTTASYIDEKGRTQFSTQNEFGEIEQPGMELRTYLAGLAMQGLLMSTSPIQIVPDRIITLAVDYADALIKKLEL